MRSPEQIAEAIATPEGLEHRHVVEAARLVLAEGLLPRDGTVLSRARQLAAEETPEAREIWEAILVELRKVLPESTVEGWLADVHPTAEGDRLVLRTPRRTIGWVARRYAPAIREAVVRLDTRARWSGLALRPYGPEREAELRPAPVYREQRRAAA